MHALELKHWTRKVLIVDTVLSKCEKFVTYGFSQDGTEDARGLPGILPGRTREGEAPTKAPPKPQEEAGVNEAVFSCQ